jgi:hypothetical protein
MVKTKQNESVHIEEKINDDVFAMYSEYQRLKDLDDKESKVIVNKVMDFLENAQGSSSVPKMAHELALPTMLVEDTIELLILKGWLVIPNEG